MGSAGRDARGPDLTGLAALAGLFGSAFIAATLLPAQSEAVLSALVIACDQPVWLLLAVASVGNVLGSVVNWGLGRGVERFRDRRWFPARGAAFDRAQRWYQRHGKWSLLLSWAPLIGDPLTLAAGVLREPFLPFLALVTIAKTLRYAVLIGIVQGLL